MDSRSPRKAADSLSHAQDVDPPNGHSTVHLTEMGGGFTGWKILSVLLIVAGAGAATVALTADVTGIGGQPGLGLWQMTLAGVGLAALLSGCALTTSGVRRRVDRFSAGVLANWRNPPAATATGSRPGVILGALLLSLAALAWPGILGKFVSLDWKVGNMRPVAIGLTVALVVLGVASILGRKWVGRVWARLFPTHKELVFACIGLTASACLTLLALEVGLRIIGRPFTDSWEPQESARAQFDPEIGWTYKPNQSRWVRFVAGQPPVRMYLNEIGARVGSDGAHFDPAAPTLILVGCSYTMGFGLSYEDTVGPYLESIPGFPFQVVNLGVEGYGTDQSMLLLKRYFDRFDTKVVIYTYMPDHNYRNSNYDRRLFDPNSGLEGTKPLFALSRDGSLYLKKRPRLYEDLSWSRVWGYIQVAWQQWGPVPDFELTRALVQEMRRYAEARGATFIVVDWDWAQSSTQGDPSPFARTGINLVDTGDEAPPGWGDSNSPWLLPNDSHPSAKANLCVAQLICKELIGLGLMSQSSIVVEK